MNWQNTPRRRAVAVLVTGLALVALLWAGGTVQVPYVALGPGPTLDLLGNGRDDNGKDTGKPVITVIGHGEDKTTGSLRLVTVSAADGLSMFEALRLWFSGEEELVPREEIYPPDKPQDQVEKENETEFSDSEELAETAAFAELGYPMRVKVKQVMPGSAAEGALQAGDWLVSVDGALVTAPGDVRKAVDAHKPGEQVMVAYERGGTLSVAQITLAPAKEDPAKGRIGVLTQSWPDVPFQVKIEVPERIGGPSGGLMFALAVVDKLGPGDLTGGADIAGTGTIDPEGRVGPIGGITHKMLGARRAGATVFLSPEQNCAEARTDVPAGMRLVKVSTLDGAVHALQDLKSGKPIPNC